MNDEGEQDGVKFKPTASAQPGPLIRWVCMTPLWMIFVLLALIARVEPVYLACIKEMEWGDLPVLTDWVLNVGVFIGNSPMLFSGGMFIVIWIYLAWVCKSQKWIHYFASMTLLLFSITGILAALAFYLPLICMSGNCVLQKTPIQTPAGPRLIELFEPGDEVLTQSDCGKIVIGRVTACYRRFAKMYLILTFDNGGPLRLTKEHRIRTSSGWVRAGTLAEDDRVIGLEGTRRIRSIECVEDFVFVYDLSVAPNANYFADRTLVHNKIGGQ